MYHEINIIGYGSQAKAWASNLRDQGKMISIILRESSKSTRIAIKDGHQVQALENLSKAGIYVLLAPDHTHQDILNYIPANSTVVFAHGYSFVRYELEKNFPSLTLLLLAPKAIASEVRNNYKNGNGFGGAFSVEAVTPDKKEEAKNLLFDLAKNIGLSVGPFECSFKQEMIADLFSEQSILCSVLPYAAKHSYERLVENEIPKEIAYLECWYEIKLIADAMIKLGPEKFFNLISPNALIGGEKAKALYFDDGYHKKNETLLNDILDGNFFKEIDQENADELRKKVVAEWNESSLTKVHREMKGQLYHEKT